MKNDELKIISTQSMLDDTSIYPIFNHAYFKELDIKCRILTGDFFADSFNFYPITAKNYYTFPELFDWQNQGIIKNNKFYKDSFKKTFFSDSFKYKTITNAFVIGSSAGNNYYRNIYSFLLRLFFIPDKKVTIAIHRNTSNSIRNFIKYFLSLKNIQLEKFIYLDDGFYLFKDCQIPSFFDFYNTMKIYRFIFPPTKKNQQNIYISRRNANWRKIINEADFYSDLQKFEFEILDFETMEVKDQIKKIQTAKRIISPHGSGLTNLIFANQENKIIEILNDDIEKELKRLYFRYKRISDYKNNSHYFFKSDTTENVNLDNNEHINRYISKEMIKQSSYYKNLILKESEFKKLISNFCKY